MHSNFIFTVYQRRSVAATVLAYTVVAGYFVYKPPTVLNSRSDEKKKFEAYETDLPTAAIIQLPSELFAGRRDSVSAGPCFRINLLLTGGNSCIWIFL